MTDTRAPVKRRPIPKMGKLTIELDPELHMEMKVAATRARVSMREFVSSAVVRKMKEQEKEHKKAS